MKDVRIKTAQELKDDDEANQFAICLLMPEEMVRKAFDEAIKLKNDGVIFSKRWDRSDGDDPITKYLAKKFDVSYTLMANRLVELKLISFAI